MNESIERRMHELREIGRRYAKAKAQRDYLTHFRKSQLAILTAEIMADSKESHASAQTKARARQEYLDVLNGLREATEQAEALYWELQLAIEGIGIWRTKRASERAEKNGYGA